MILACHILCECDQCGEEEEMEVANTDLGFDRLELIRVLKQSGWVLQETFHGNRMICLECVESIEDNEDDDDGEDDESEDISEE